MIKSINLRYKINPYISRSNKYITFSLDSPPHPDPLPLKGERIKVRGRGKGLGLNLNNFPLRIITHRRAR
jgi:hypothetical protein